MYGILDLTWVPTEDEPTPPDGKAGAVVRNDDYDLPIVFTNPDATPFSLEGTWAAQVRTTKAGATDPGVPLASFGIDVVDNTLNLNLPAAVTLELPSSWVWDLQRTLAGSTQTLFSGKGKTVDDVTRS